MWKPRPIITEPAPASGQPTRRTLTARAAGTGASSLTAAAAAAAATFSATSPFAQAAAASATAVAARISTRNASEEVAVWTSDRPLRRLPASLDDPAALAAAARMLPGYGEGPELYTLEGEQIDLSAAERAFLQLLRTPGLDERLAAGDEEVEAAAALVGDAVDIAVWRAFGPRGDDGSPESDAYHTFLQRMLYRINRLNHFWYDDLRNYENERSGFVAGIRDRIEGEWQAWERDGRAGAVPGQRLFAGLSVQQLIDEVRERAARDVDPPLGPVASYIREQMSFEGYRHLLAVGALDGLVEASRQSRVCAGAPNSVATTVFRVLMEEYGNGKLPRKHSTFYHSMMSQLGLDTRPEAYFDLVPWQWLASANHNFLLTERRRHYLRYLGGLTYFEVNGPSVYRTYCAAAQRLGLPPDAWGYWELHVREDERHGRQMVEEVAVPLIQRYGVEDGWEVLWGYDQEVAMGRRAGQALVDDIRAMEAEEAAAEAKAKPAAKLAA
ncbi:hypothetical protein PLESTF_000737200 [Pleodorina starrii]|nr:hypothetical protein PLESTF_000737200 [Pleodorina starrii]